MVEWNQLDAASFLEQASGFLAEHGQLDGPSCNAPPAKRARSVGLSSMSQLSFSISSLSDTVGISTVTPQKCFNHSVIIFCFISCIII